MRAEPRYTKLYTLAPSHRHDVACASTHRPRRRHAGARANNNTADDKHTCMAFLHIPPRPVALIYDRKLPKISNTYHWPIKCHSETLQQDSRATPSCACDEAVSSSQRKQIEDTRSYYSSRYGRNARHREDFLESPLSCMLRYMPRLYL